MTVAETFNASEWLACIYATRREGPFIVTFAENYEEMDALRKRAVRVLPGDCGITQPALVVWCQVCGNEEAAVALANRINHLTILWQRGLIESINPQWVDLGAVVSGCPVVYAIPIEEGFPYYQAAQL